MPGTTVLIAYKDVDSGTATSKIEAVSEGVRVLSCPYETSHAVRTLRDEDSWSPRIPELMPALSEAQRSAFARADVALALDVPLDLGVVAPRLCWVQSVGSGFSRYRSAGLGEAGEVGDVRLEGEDPPPGPGESRTVSSRSARAGIGTGLVSTCRQMSRAMISAPSSASLIAWLRPIPRAAPVTTATSPAER
jgi:hypothetical protein